MLIAVCAIISVSNVFAQTVNIPWLQKQEMKKNARQLKSGVVGSYPQHTDEYNWGVDWAIYQTIETSYNTNGDPLSIEYNQGGVRKKNLYTYNNQHLQTEELIQVYSGSAWENQSRTTTTYNTLGYDLENRMEQWTGTAWVLQSGTQSAYELDGDRVRVATVKDWKSESSTWVNSSRETYTYTGTDARYSTIIAEQWNDAWVNQSKMEVSWSGNNISQFISYSYENGAWVLSSKMIYQWLENNSSIMTVYSYVGADTWMQSMRTTTNYDSHGNMTLNQAEMYFGTSWMIYTSTRYLLTYSGNNLTQRITQTFNTVQWANMLKEAFSNFASLSTDITLMPDSGMVVFPNPAGNQALVRISLLKSESFTLTVLTVTGQKVIEQTFTGHGSDYIYPVNLEQVPSGSYILMARDQQGAEIGKTRLIKQ